MAQDSGLFDAIRALHVLHTDLLLTPHLNPLQEAMAATFQSYHISTRLTCVLDIWRKDWNVDAATVPMFSPCRPPGRPDATAHDAAELMRLFEEEAINIPAQVDLYSLFFILSEFNFAHHWHLWILPSLKRFGAGKSLLEGG
jgi:hypothetical protein